MFVQSNSATESAAVFCLRSEAGTSASSAGLRATASRDPLSSSGADLRSAPDAGREWRDVVVTPASRLSCVLDAAGWAASRSS